MQVLDVCQPPAPPERSTKGLREPRQIPKGLRSPFFGSASGLVWLAAHDDDDVTVAAIARCHRELGRYANDSELILNGIRRVRERGYVCGGYSHDDRVWAVTMALPPSAAGIIMVLGVVGPAERISADREKIVALCRKKIAEHLRVPPS
jgi:DNA-binding IclR family transcriptional regulator